MSIARIVPLRASAHRQGVLVRFGGYRSRRPIADAPANTSRNVSAGGPLLCSSNRWRVSGWPSFLRCVFRGLTIPIGRLGSRRYRQIHPAPTASTDALRRPNPHGSSWGRLSFPALPGLPGSSTDLFLRAVPNHPGRSDRCLLIASPPVSGFIHIRRTGHLQQRHEAESGSLTLRLTGLLPRFPPVRSLRLAPVLLHARMSNLHGEFLSIHKISQAWPGVPDERRSHRLQFLK